MSETVPVSSADGTWVGESKPDSNHVEDERIRLRASDRVGFLRLECPVPVGQGAVVVQAILRLTPANATSGAAVTLTPLASGMKAGRATWNNRAAVDGDAVPVVVFPYGPAGEPFEVDVTDYVQEVANGARNFGWEITTADGDGLNLRGPRAATGSPSMDITYSLRPGTPVDLVPADGAVSVAQPMLAYAFVDPQAAEAVAAHQIQVTTADDPDFEASVFESGWEETDVPVIDLATFAEGALSLVDGDDRLWRVRTRSTGGAESDWSAGARLARIDKGVLTILSPVGGTATDFSPVIAWSLAGVPVQKAWRVYVTDPETGERVADSGWNNGPDTTWEVPEESLGDPGPWEVTVRVRDDQDREATPGDPRATVVSETFIVEFAGAAGVDTIGAQKTGINRPSVTVTWERGTAPDWFRVLKDGLPISKRLLPEDTLVGPGAYEWIDPTGSTGRTATYQVLCGVDGSTSTINPEAVFEGTGTYGVWVGDPDEDMWVRLTGATLSQLAAPDRATVLWPAGSRRAFRSVSGVSGKVGPIGGVIRSTRDGYDAAAGRAALLAMKENPTREYLVVGADMVMRALLGDIVENPDDDSTARNRRWRASMTVIQTGNFGFRNPRGLRRG